MEMTVKLFTWVSTEVNTALGLYSMPRDCGGKSVV